MASDFTLTPAELESASRLRTMQFLVTKRPWLDLYGVNVKPVAPIGSTSSKPFIDPAPIHRCLPDELLFEILLLRISNHCTCVIAYFTKRYQ